MRKLLVALAVLIVAAFLIFNFLLPNLHFGSGNGDGNGNGQEILSDDVSSPTPNSSEENSISEIEIRIEENDIYFDDELCIDKDDLKQKIIDAGTESKYTFISDNALKATYDDVQAILSNLETALGITVVED